MTAQLYDALLCKKSVFSRKNFPVKRPLSGNYSRRTGFAADCTHHHPVFAKPHVSDTTPNRGVFSCGDFRATHFLDFWSSCRRSRILVAILALLSLHPKIPFPAAGLLSTKLDPQPHP